MKRRLVVGLTGGIASGKSTVLDWLAKRRIPTQSADLVVRECMRPGTSVYRAILRRFGRNLCRPDGALERAKLGSIVFKDAKARRALERIVHPCVIKAQKAFIRSHRGLVVLDIPLLFEAKLESLVDHVVVVYAHRHQQMARMKARNGFTTAEARRRLAAQWPLKRKAARAHQVLKNTGTKAELRKQVNAWLEKTLDSIRS